ncbi:MAG: hypothetical protein HYZ75_06855 [Elusimicrobia bacterium]|nr:hypothetical protein [Elusimicrobiota bacterium]
MNAVQYLAWARPLLGLPVPAVGKFFLGLPEALLGAAGPGHFLESSVGSARGLERVKLALILDEDRPALERDAKRRDAPGKAKAAADLLTALGEAYDAAPARAALAALARWELRGSLMLSLDYDRPREALDKLSLYGYLPGVKALRELLSVVGREADEPGLRRLAGEDLAFFGLDLAPGAPAALKLYNKALLPGPTLPGTLARAAQSLSEVAPLRDLTTLTRVGSASPPKAYLGFSRGAPLSDLSRLRFFGERGWLCAAAKAVPGARARFVGVDDGAFEVYFDAAGFGPAEAAA